MFVGVDESNHNKFPEIFVGAYSLNASHVKRHEYDTYNKKGAFEKQREVNPDLRRFMDVPYKHIIFTKVIETIVGKINFPVIAVAELALYANTQRPVKKIFIDGELSEQQVQAIEKIIHPSIGSPKIILQPHLDETVRLVNEADNRANFLHRYYAKYPVKGSRKLDYVHTLLSPRLDDYLPYLI